MVKISEDSDVRFGRSIKTGPHNFIWISTNNGLCRFDGKHFKYYKHDPEDPESIFSDEVMCLLPIGDEIWAGTLQGISVLNTKTQKFRNYQLGETGKVDTIVQGSQHNTSVIFEDRQGDIWIGTRFRGLWKYVPERDDFVRIAPNLSSELAYSSDQPGLITDIVQSLDNDSLIWVATSAGLLEINKYREGGRYHTFPMPTASSQRSTNFFRKLYVHPNGLLYTSSWQGGIRVFDPQTGELSLLEPENDHDQAFSTYSIYSLNPQSGDEIWISSGYGLFLYSISRNRILYQVKNDERQQQYFGVSLVDEDQRIWYSNFQGLFLYDPFIQQFHTYSFDQELKDNNASLVFLQAYDQENDRIVVCPRFTDGIYLFDRRTKSWTVSRFGNVQNFAANGKNINIYGMVRLQNDDYILAGMEGLFRYNLNDRRLIPLLDTDLPEGTWFSSLYLDEDKKLWIGTTNSGLMQMDPYSGRYTYHQDDVGNKLRHPPRIDLLFEDSRGNIWMKRTGGLSVYMRAENRIRDFRFSDTPENSFLVTNAFAEDQQGRIWTCSEEGRIGYMEAANPEKGIVKKFSIQDSGLEGQIYGLISDPEGGIWGYSAKDIFRINEHGQVVSHISLKYNSVPIDYFGMIMLPDGQLVVGGRREITFTNPKELKRNQELPEPYITQVTVRQKPLDNAYSLFDMPPLELKHHENFFSIAYAAQAFTFGEDVRYRYRLKDLEDWNDAGNGLVANYTSVPPGEYTFQLMAANNEGMWNPELLEVPVIIQQAWYKSWWFLTLLGLFFAGMVYAFFSYRVQQVRKEEKIKANYEKKLAGVEMSALVSQMNPHFLFNSLNSIDSYIIRNQSFKASEYLNSFARLMRLILQNSRSNYISLQNEIEGLELYLQMECLRSEGLFSYAIHLDPEVDIHMIEIPPMLIQPYIENAIWHGVRHLENGTPGQVDLHIGMQADKLKICVRDNGVGRERSAEIQRRKSDSHKRSMGMQITKSRIEMINKLYNADASVVINDLYDDNGQPTGTTVSLTIAI